jgi:nicotinate-nucleotide adenylyltransferase
MAPLASLRYSRTAIEAAIGSTYTINTICYLKQPCPGVRFIWLMGADNFRYFDCWQRWRDIARLVPIAIIDRPGSTLTALHGRAAEALAPYRLDETDGARLAFAAPPVFMFLHGPRSPMSCAEIREKPRSVAAADKINAR